MDERSYGDVKRAHLSQIRGQLGKYGITVPEGDDVEVNGPFGVSMQMTYDEPGETLKLAITKKPGFVPASQIWKVVERGASGFRKT